MPLSLNLAELAPAAPALEALPILLALAGLIFALGLIKLVHGFVHAVFWGVEKGVGWIPFAKKVVSVPIHKIEQRMTHWLGEAEQSIDNYIGWCFHNMAALVRQAAREIAGLAHDLWLVGAVIPTLVSAVVMRHFVTALLHPIRTAQHIINRLLHTARVAVHSIEHTVTAGVYPRIRAGEAALDRVIEWDIPHLRARDLALSRLYDRLWRWSKAHARPIATAAFVAAVAVALRRLGGNWIRCKNWRRIGKAGCGLPLGLIEHLLGFAAEVYLIHDMCAFIPKLQRLAIQFEPALLELVNEVEGFVCGGKASAPSAIVASDWQPVSDLPSAL
jgi:hypothetical protein